MGLEKSTVTETGVFMSSEKSIATKRGVFMALEKSGVRFLITSPGFLLN